MKDVWNIWAPDILEQLHQDIDTWYYHEALRNGRGDTKNDDFWYTRLILLHTHQTVLLWSSQKSRRPLKAPRLDDVTKSEMFHAAFDNSRGPPRFRCWETLKCTKTNSIHSFQQSISMDCFDIFDAIGSSWLRFAFARLLSQNCKLSSDSFLLNWTLRWQRHGAHISSPSQTKILSTLDLLRCC